MGLKKRRGFFFESALKLKKAGVDLLVRDNPVAATRSFLAAVREDPSLEPDILTEYEKAVIRTNFNLKFKLALADFLLENGQLSEARGELEELIIEAPQEAAPFVKLGKIYFRWGLNENLAVLFSQAPPAAGGDLMFLENTATSLLKLGRHPEAARIFEQLAQKNPRSIKFLKILGEIYLVQGQLEKAAGYFQQVVDSDKGAIQDVGLKLKSLLEKDPGNSFLIKTLGDFYLKTLKPDLAVEEYQKFLQLPNPDYAGLAGCLKRFLEVYPDFPGALLAQAELKIMTNDLSEAVDCLGKLLPQSAKLSAAMIELLTKIVGLCPGQIMAHQLLAEVFLHQGTPAAALEEIGIFLTLCPAEAVRAVTFCQQILKTEPQNLRALELLAEAYFCQKNYKKTQEVVEDLISRDKNFAPAYRILGEVAAAENRLEAAYKYYQKALALDENSFLVHGNLKETGHKILEKEILGLLKEIGKSPWRTRLHLELAQKYYRLGDLDSALAEGQLALNDLTATAEAEFCLGQCFFEKGLFEKSFRHFKKCAAAGGETRQPLARQALFQAGLCRENQGRLREALEIYGTLEELEPGWPDPLQRRASLEKQPGVVLKSLAAILVGDIRKPLATGVYAYCQERLIKKELRVSFGDTYNNRGFTHFQADELPAAEEEFSLAVQLDPELMVAWNNLGVLLLRQVRLEEAREIFEKVIYKNPNYWPARNNLAVYFLLTGVPAKARQLFQEIRKEDPAGIFWLNFGDLFYSGGEIKEAVFAWEKARFESALGPLVKKRLQYIKPERGPG